MSPKHKHVWKVARYGAASNTRGVSGKGRTTARERACSCGARQLRQAGKWIAGPTLAPATESPSLTDDEIVHVLMRPSCRPLKIGEPSWPQSWQELLAPLWRTGRLTIAHAAGCPRSLGDDDSAGICRCGLSRVEQELTKRLGKKGTL